MPRFSVAFGRRKPSTVAEDFQNAEAPAEPSFRVLERSDASNGKSFDGGARMAKATTTAVYHRPTYSQVSGGGDDDNMFADLKATNNNRGSGSTNTTKTTSTDTSSRHSNVSTAPSSADLGHHGGQEEWNTSSSAANKRSYGSTAPPLQQQQQQPFQGDMAGPTAPKPPSRGFLERAGRTFSFGSNKKSQQPVPSEDDFSTPPVPPLPNHMQYDTGVPQQQQQQQRSRGFTASTTSTATPPTLEDSQDYSMDMGGEFGKMFDTKFKRNSAMTLRAMATQQQDGPMADPPSSIPTSASEPRSLTGNRSTLPAAPAPLNINNSAKVEPSPFSWDSQNSHDGLLDSASSDHNTASMPPLPPKHGSPLEYKPSQNNRPSDIIEDEDANLLRDSLAATRFLGDSGPRETLRTQAFDQPPSGRGYRRNESPGAWKNSVAGDNTSSTEDNMFAGNMGRSSRIAASRPTASQAASPGRHKVMTPAEFERYKLDKERQSTISLGDHEIEPVEDDDDADNYEDDEDDVEKAKQAAKQRKKQEAHMSVYRQQMMKVTGDSNDGSRPFLPQSMSSPNLGNLAAAPAGISAGRPDDDDEDEEVPLAILAAHGFPNKNKANQMSTMASNPDLRASMLVQQPMQQQQQQPARPGSSMGDASGGQQNQANRSSTLPAFARRLPQDPFLGAGLVNGPSRESMNLSGGAQPPGARPNPEGPQTPGGLVGVIATEERSRAMRRGSPHIDAQNIGGGGYQQGGGPGFDPIQGVPQHMMYNQQQMAHQMAQMGMPQMPSMGLSAGDQAQIQMTQQMSQFMQMQMQFMQMMSGNQQNGGMPARPMSHMPQSPSVADMSSRQSFVGDMNQFMSPMHEPQRPTLDPHMRTMSMVQPNSESWIRPGAGGYAPSIHAQGTGYTPSIAPSERSNVGLPGRYRPVSQASHAQPGQAPDFGGARRTSTMSGALNGWEQQGIRTVGKKTPSPPLGRVSKQEEDDDDEEGWEAMRAKREKKRSLWRSKKIGSDLGALIS